MTRRGFAVGGFAAFSGGALAILHGREAIIPLAALRVRPKPQPIPMDMGPRTSTIVDGKWVETPMSRLRFASRWVTSRWPSA